MNESMKKRKDITKRNLHNVNKMITVLKNNKIIK